MCLQTLAPRIHSRQTKMRGAQRIPNRDLVVVQLHSGSRTRENGPRIGHTRRHATTIHPPGRGRVSIGVERARVNSGPTRRRVFAVNAAPSSRPTSSPSSRPTSCACFGLSHRLAPSEEGRRLSYRLCNHVAARVPPADELHGRHRRQGGTSPAAVLNCFGHQAVLMATWPPYSDQRSLGPSEHDRTPILRRSFLRSLQSRRVSRQARLERGRPDSLAQSGRTCPVRRCR